MVDITNFYGAPVTDFSFLFEANKKENKDAIARYNATMLAVLDSSSGRPSDPRQFFNSEYSFMSGTDISSQNQYLRGRVAEMTQLEFQRAFDMVMSATKAGLPSAIGPAPSIDGTPTEDAPPAALTAIQQLQQRAQTIGETQQQLAAYTPNNTIVRGDGAISAMAAINAYRGAQSATDRAKIEADYNNYLKFQTLETLGHDVDLISIEMIDDWLKEFVPGKFLYETTRYGGLLSQIEFNNLSPEQRMAYSAEVAQSLIDANADPLTIDSTLDRFRTDQPLFSGPVATGVVGALDLFGLGGLVKYGPKAARFAEKIAILRKLKNAPAVAAGTGDTRVAGSLSGSVLLGDAAQALAIGIDRTTAGMNASPFRFSQLDSAVTDGIAADTLKFIEDERRVLNYKLNQAVNPDTTSSTGFLRPEERLVAERTILSRLPQEAEIVERTPFGVQIRVVTKNNAAFQSPEELLVAENRYDAWREAYEQAVDEVDRFYADAATGRFDIDSAWINRLEASKASAKQEMDDAYRILTKGIEPDKIDERFVFYTRSMMDGTFDGVLDVGGAVPFVASPSTIFSNLDSLMVAEKTAILAQQAKLNKLYKKLMSDALANLSSKQAKNLDAVLLHGDDLGAKFTIAELQRGVDVPGLGTVKLNKQQIASYYKARDIFDNMHGVHNITKYRRFKFDNFKQTNIILDDGSDTLRTQKFYVQDAVITSTNAAGDTVVRLPSANLILDARGSSAAKMTKFDGAFRNEILNAVKDGKAWVVKFEKPVRVGEEMLNYGIIRGNRLKDIDLNIIPYRTGYVPRIYEAVPYVVRQDRKVRFDGTDVKNTWVTERFFMNRSEADAWAASRTQEDGVVRVTDTDYNWRGRDSEYAAEMNDSVRSGLYETERGEAIPFGTLGEEAARSSAFASMDRYLGNLAHTVPLNEWRQGIVQRYFNSVNEYLINPNEFGHLTDSNLFKAGTPQNVINAVQESGKYIQEQIGLAGTGERAFTNLARSIADNIENSFFWKSVGKVAPSLPEKAKLSLLYGADNVNAYAWLRNAAFRAYLGFFSIPQLYVQASNMVTVASLHPTNFLSVGRRIMALRSVGSLSTSAPDYEKIVSIAAKSGLMKYDDFEPIVRAWIKSGLYYTTRISADTAMASRGISPGGDLSRASGFVDNALLFPYQEAELWARTYAFLDSATRFRKANPNVDITNIDVVNDIVRESFKTAFNYTQANKAWWQSGATSIPTQFLQAPMKFYEALLAPLNGKYKGQFTLAQRARLVFGQLLLFGTAGIPAGNFFKDQIANWLTTQDENGVALHPNLDQTQLEALTGGMADLAASAMLGTITGTDTSVAVAERMALGGGLNLTISNILAEDADAARILLGAVGGVAFQRALPALEHVIRVHGTQIAAGTFTPSDVLRVADKLGTITSSWNAVHRARLWERHNAIVTREGTEILELDPTQDRGIILAKAFGFRSYDEIAAFRIRDYNEEANPDKEIRDAVRSAAAILNEYNLNRHMSEEESRGFSQELYMIRESLLDEGAKTEFDSQWGQFLMDSDSLAAKEYRKFIDRMMIYDPEVMGTPQPPADFGVLQERALEELQGY